MTVLLKGGEVVDPAQDLKRKADVLLEKGRVSKVGRVVAQEGWRVVDVSGMYVVPGLIDMHVHLREPG